MTVGVKNKKKVSGMKINKFVGIMPGFTNGIYGSLPIYCFEIVWLIVGLSQSVESQGGISD